MPLAYYLFTLGYNPVFAFVGKFSTMVISQLYRLYFINKKIKFNHKEFVLVLSECQRSFGLLLGIIYISDTTRSYSFIGIYWTIHHFRNGINLCHFNLRIKTQQKKISCLAI